MEELLTARSEEEGTAAAVDRRLRVLLIAPSMEIVGGQAIQAVRLLDRLREEPGISIDFAPINPRLVGPLRFAKDIRYLRTLLRSILFNTDLLRRLHSYDVIHVFSAGLTSYTLWTIPALLISKLYRRPVIVNYRDGQAEQHLNTFRSALPTLRMADLVVTPSAFVVDVFSRYGVPARCIFNIVDLDRFRYRRRRKLRPVFLTNRSLEPHYNVECTLRAFALIQKQYPQATLTVAHDGPSRAKLEKLAHNLSLHNTTFIGSVSHDRIADLYDTADIYLMSPNIDCMPGSLLECFASGLPVISTKAGGVPYMIEDETTGLLVELNDHEAMANRALRLLNDAQLAEYLAENAREQVKKYHWNYVRDQWLATYRELALKS